MGYAGVHQRLNRERGSAKALDCAACGRPAEQWAYTGPRQAGEKQPYSTNLDLYEPQCVRCHKRYDLAAIAAVEKHPGDVALF